MFLKHTKQTKFSALQLQNNSYYNNNRDKRAKILFALKM